jgi:hypothetical protein
MAVFCQRAEDNAFHLQSWIGFSEGDAEAIAAGTRLIFRIVAIWQ